jgi:DNA-binding NarL/FixJ family response regulator
VTPAEIVLQTRINVSTLPRVTQPLALIFYQKLLPGSTLANRLRDLNYRVHAVNQLSEFLSVATSERPMVLVIDASPEGDAVAEAIRTIRANSKTAHVPILSFAEDETRQAAARIAGATLATSDAAISAHLGQLLEQVLAVE